MLLQDAVTYFWHPMLEDDAVIAEWTYNVLVDALIRLSTIPDEKIGPWVVGGKQTMLHSGLVVYANCSLKILAACEQQPTCVKRRLHTASTLVFWGAAAFFPNHAIFNSHSADPHEGKAFWRGSPRG